MSIIVNLPNALGVLADGRVQVELETEVATVGEVLETLRREMPTVYDRVVTEQGELRPHINVFVGTEDIRWSGGFATPVSKAAEVHIIPAVSGG